MDNNYTYALMARECAKRYNLCTFLYMPFIAENIAEATETRGASLIIATSGAKGGGTRQ